MGAFHFAHKNIINLSLRKIIKIDYNNSVIDMPILEVESRTENQIKQQVIQF